MYLFVMIIVVLAWVRLVDTVMAHPELQGLRRMMLATSDMHSLYAQFGFENVQNDNKILMEIVKPDLYKPT